MKSESVTINKDIMIEKIFITDRHVLLTGFCGPQLPIVYSINTAEKVSLFKPAHYFYHINNTHIINYFSKL